MRWLRRAAIVLTLCVVSHSVDAQDQADQQPPVLEFPSFDELQTGIVTRILDENTVLVRIDSKTQRYDLLGVADFGLSDQKQAALAIDSLSRMMLHEQVWVQHDPRGARLKDSNRLAGYLFRSPDQLLVNLELVRQGYAKYVPRGMSIHRDVFAYQQDRAQEFKRGVWAPVAATPTEQVEPEKTPVVQPQAMAPVDDWVYVTPHGKRYHRKECHHLGSSTKRASRDEVSGSHQPCKTCRPDG